MTVGKIVVGTKDEVYYYGSATQSDANALAESLNANAFLGDRGVDVFLAKGDGSTSITFLVAQDSWDNPETVASFDKLVREAAPAIGGLPIELRLADNRLETKKVESVN